MNKFQQLPLSRMKRGLAREIAVIDLSPSRFDKMFGIKFTRTKDSLAICDAALLEMGNGKQFGLRTYPQGPHPQWTELIADERSNAPRKDVFEFLSIIPISSSHILWMRPYEEGDL